MKENFKKSGKAQEQKSRILAAMPKKAQEEIVGFTIIILLVAVILVIFLSFSLKSPKENTVKSYEAENFLQALTQKTTDCGSPDNLRYYSIKELLFKCYSSSALSGETCFDDRDVCEVFLKEVGLASNQSWNPGIGSDFPIKGYNLTITVDGEYFKHMGGGNKTQSSKGSFQELMKEGRLFRLEFYAYY